MPRQHQPLVPSIVPAWTYEGKTPGVFTFFESIALAGLEDKVIKLDASTQRTLLGFPVFGRRAIKVLSETSSVESTVKVGFGMDYAEASWTAARIREAAQACSQLHPAY